ncbi:hypothetical protein [Cyclobacterium sp. SYSU L10401]|uniref:hypothetical protein n=1 Tax=Cyclobacterium sp. SYSU L10401 TaxID=2678657 RepID=UPI0013D4C611|nr:hypothetical protein [Cyclobacterium sp. SYSU L10401]
MTKNSKQKAGLKVLINFLQYTFLGSALLIILLQVYIYSKSETTSLMDQMDQMEGAIYPFVAFLVVTILKNKKIIQPYTDEKS